VILQYVESVIPKSIHVLPDCAGDCDRLCKQGSTKCNVYFVTISLLGYILKWTSLSVNTGLKLVVGTEIIDASCAVNNVDKMHTPHFCNHLKILLCLFLLRSPVIMHNLMMYYVSAYNHVTVIKHDVSGIEYYGSCEAAVYFSLNWHCNVVVFVNTD